MNTKNALGFIVLGLAMYTVPSVAQALGDATVGGASTVRVVWLEFMGWVVGGIGAAYLSREGALWLVASLAPARRWLAPMVERAATEPLPEGVRSSISN